MAVTLICGCGRRIKAPGAVPGRVGRCPACGAELRVPDTSVSPPPPPPPADDSWGGGYGLSEMGAPPSRTSYPERAPIGTPERVRDKTVAEDRGLIVPPRRPEGTLGEALAYPFWGLPGIVLMVVMPPVLWLFTGLSIGLVPSYTLGNDERASLMSLLLIFPMAILLLLALGYLASYLERVVVDAAAGEVYHPRMPDWTIGGYLAGVFRLLLCGLAGFLIPGFLAALYWLNCGDLDWADGSILLTILTPGAVAAVIAWAAVVVHDDVRAANPFTVLAALGRVGTPAWGLGLGITVPVAFTAAAVPLLWVAPSFVAVIGIYGFWLVVTYESLVISWILGGFCRRHNDRLQWFDEHWWHGQRG